MGYPSRYTREVDKTQGYETLGLRVIVSVPSPSSKNLFVCMVLSYGALRSPADPHSTDQLCFIHLSLTNSLLQ